MRFTEARAPKFRTLAPKLRKLEVQGLSNGLMAIHHFDAGAPRKFVFKSPAKLGLHLERTLKGHWQAPTKL